MNKIEKIEVCIDKIKIHRNIDMYGLRIEMKKIIRSQLKLE